MTTPDVSHSSKAMLSGFPSPLVMEETRDQTGDALAKSKLKTREESRVLITWT